MARLRRSGRVDFLRAHELKTGYGPGHDHIDVEFVGRVSGESDHTFGATLRTDERLPSHQAMFQLLRDGIVNSDLETTVEYDIDLDGDEEDTNGILVRVELRPS